MEANTSIERVVTDETLGPMLSEHYVGARAQAKDFKQLLHSASNGGTPEDWRRECGAPPHADPLPTEDLEPTTGDVTHEFAAAGAGLEAVRVIAVRFPTKTSCCQINGPATLNT